MPHDTENEPPGDTGDPGFSVASVAWANGMSLWHRIGRGEGLLLAINLSIVVARWPGIARFVAQALVSSAVLVLLYFLNDVFDAERDLKDPGKDQRFVGYLVRHRRRLGWILVGEHLVTLVAAFVFLGPRSALAVAAVFAVNIAYSAGLKGRPALDVPWVAAWGGLYAMVTGLDVPLTIYAAVAAMTGITHVFQITRDRGVDAENRIRTSAVAAPWLPALYMGASCLVMALCLAAHLGPWVGATAAIPFALYLGMRSNQAAWLLAKAYYGVMWLLLLGAIRNA